MGSATSFVNFCAEQLTSMKKALSRRISGISQSLIIKLKYTPTHIHAPLAYAFFFLDIIGGGDL